MLSNPLKRALAESFQNFNEYQFAKYKGTGKGTTLKDVLRIVHPKPIDQAQSELFKRIRDNTLKVPDTWEVYISTHGSTKENWEYIMPKMPVMATLRNLRNFSKVGADVTSVIKALNTEKIILNSKQFPYRFYSAYKALDDSVQSGELTGRSVLTATQLMSAVQNAMEISVKNIPRIKGTTFLTADNSASMDSPMSQKSKVSYKDVANLLQAIGFKFCDTAITSVFGDTFAVVPVVQTSPILSNMQRFKSTDVGCSTNAFLAFQWLLDNKMYVDRVLMFSDMQVYNSSSYVWRQPARSVAELLRAYRKKINPELKFYSFDLAGYGTLTVPERDTYLVAGWSDKVLEFINLNETKGISAIQKVESYLPILKKKIRDDGSSEGSE